MNIFGDIIKYNKASLNISTVHKHDNLMANRARKYLTGGKCIQHGDAGQGEGPSPGRYRAGLG